MVHCKLNNIDFQSSLTLLLLVTSQTGSDIVEMREVEALSNLRRRRPRGPSLGRISRRKAAAVSLENTKISLISMRVLGAGPRPCSIFLSLTTPRFPPIHPGWTAHMCPPSHRTQGSYNTLGAWFTCPRDFD